MQVANAFERPPAQSEADRTVDDALCFRAAAWLRKRAEADAALRDWQRLESQLFKVHGPLTVEEAVKLGIDYGIQMQAVDVGYAGLSRELQREARAILRSRPRSLASALTKVELGLQMRCEDNGDGDAWAMVESGLRYLRQHSAK